MKPKMNVINRTEGNKAKRIVRQLLFCVIILGITSGANAANIIAFGDSITASGSYPSKLSTLLNSNNKPSVVVNKGVGMETTPEGLARFDSVLASFPANFILIMEGTNDVGIGLSVETTRYNLQAMINKSKAAGVTPVLATLTPSDRAASPTLIPQVWNPMIVSLASSNGIYLADQYAATLPTWGAANVDGLHPNDAGHQVIANTWYSVIGPMISSTGSSTGGVSLVSSTDSKGSSSGGGCFIATAAFGTSMEKHVRILTEFRDIYLLNNYPGQQFIKAYYKYSPPVANFIRQNDGIRFVVRVLLYPLVGFSFVLLKFSLIWQLYLGGVFLICLFFSCLSFRPSNKHKNGV